MGPLADRDVRRLRERRRMGKEGSALDRVDMEAIPEAEADPSPQAGARDPSWPGPLNRVPVLRLGWVPDPGSQPQSNLLDHDLQYRVRNPYWHDRRADRSDF